MMSCSSGALELGVVLRELEGPRGDEAQTAGVRPWLRHICHMLIPSSAHLVAAESLIFLLTAPSLKSECNVYWEF